MFRLAALCGRWDVDGLLSDMTPAQWGEWIAYDRIEPIGEKRADLRNAQHLAHLLRMMSAMVGGDPDSIEERNFLPYVPELQPVAAPVQDERITQMALETLARQFNAARR